VRCGKEAAKRRGKRHANVQFVYRHLAAAFFNAVQAIDDAGVVAGKSRGVAQTGGSVAAEYALWRAAHTNNSGAKTYIWKR
jgi:hypothetical protein